MKIAALHRRPSGFTLAEMMIVIAIIVILAALTIGGYNFAMRGSKRRVTESTMTAVQSSLERYFDQFGEYPEPASNEEVVEMLPGKRYNVGGAKCLYQALRGDGYDAIKGASNTTSGGSASSDGNFSDEEIPRVLFKDMPATMWRKVSGSYILVDGFFNPFQYVKAPTPTPSNNSDNSSSSQSQQTINSTYDIWSYADDDVNTKAKSYDAKDTPTLSAKWVKNW